MKMAKEPISLDFLPFEDVEAGKPLKASFRFPGVDHPIYGKTTQLQGSVDLILPQGYAGMHVTYFHFN